MDREDEVQEFINKIRKSHRKQTKRFFVAHIILIGVNSILLANNTYSILTGKYAHNNIQCTVLGITTGMLVAITIQQIFQACSLFKQLKEDLL